ncbi:PAS domain S-box-containing protein [Rhodovulum bhavnagarense]|uniref:histidine kinase n=1 Tax=Rhodovulum bhavnagarense TaxID=992286 RepID=A0A4R2RBE9_9RHOB|nr:PAS domain-containing protein [Rhodovulum bhavnagarense]TCP60662.1 PAS domain S-box-containing protein [Rhodovulum bhavnagarense]
MSSIAELFTAYYPEFVGPEPEILSVDLAFSPLMACATSGSEELLYGNADMAVRLGLTLEDLETGAWLDRVQPDGAENLREAWRTFLQTRRPLTLKLSVQTGPQDAVHRYRLVCIAYRHPLTGADCALVAAANIDFPERALRYLDEAQGALAAVHAGRGAVSLTLDADARIVAITPEARKLLDLDETGTAEGVMLKTFLAEENHSDLDDCLQDSGGRGVRAFATQVRSKGGPGPFIEIFCHRTGNGSHDDGTTHCSIIGLHDQLAASQLLHIAHGRSGCAGKVVPGGLIGLDAGGRIVLADDHAATILGRPAQELVGCAFRDLAQVAPGDEAGRAALPLPPEAGVGATHCAEILVGGAGGPVFLEYIATRLPEVENDTGLSCLVSLRDMNGDLTHRALQSLDLLVLSMVAMGFPRDWMLAEVGKAIGRVFPEVAVLFMSPDKRGHMSRVASHGMDEATAAACEALANAPDTALRRSIEADARFTEWNPDVLPQGPAWQKAYSLPLKPWNGDPHAVAVLLFRQDGLPEQDRARTLGKIADTLRLKAQYMDRETKGQATEQRFRFLFEAMPTALIELDFTETLSLFEMLRSQGVNDLAAHIAAHPEGAAALLASVRVVGGNPLALRRYGVDSQSALIVAFDEVLNGDEFRETLQKAFVAMYEGAAFFEAGRVVRRQDGTLRKIEVRFAFPNPEIGRGIIAEIDNTAREQALERFTVLARTISDAVVEYNLRTDKVWYVDGLERTLGFSAEEMGTSLASFIGLVHPEDVEKALTLFNSFKARADADSNSLTLRMQRADGSWAITEIHAAPLMDELGQPERIVASLHDISAKMKEQQRQRLIAEVACDAAFEHDIEADEFVWDGGLKRHFGIDPSEIRTMEEWKNHIHPDDQHRLTEIHNDVLAMKLATATGTVRLRCGDGRHVWTDLRIKVLHGANGKPSGVIGAVENIDDRIAYEARVGTLLELAADVIFEIDPVNGTVWHNVLGTPYLAGRRGWLPLEAADQGDAIHPDDREGLRQQVALIHDGDLREIEALYRHMTMDDTWVELVTRVRVERDENDKAVRLIGFTRKR